MALVIAATPVPLSSDSDGVVRTGSTRVTLDTVISAFGRGTTAEEIVQQYPSLNLADVYAVLGYYLHHRTEVDAYVRQHQELAVHVRQQHMARFDQAGVRDRVLARRRSGGMCCMLRLAADEHVTNDLVRGILRREQDVDIVRMQDVGCSGADDPTVLTWTAGEGRMVLTHEVATLTAYAYERVSAGQVLPGVVAVRQSAAAARCTPAVYHALDAVLVGMPLVK